MPFPISFAMRCILAAALVVATTTMADEPSSQPRDAAEAADAAMKASQARADADEKAASAQLIRESRVLFPQRAGKFELQRSARDPEPKNGVVMVYRYDGDLDTDFEIRALPLGQLPEHEAVALAALGRKSCLHLRTGGDTPVLQLQDPWAARTVTLADGRTLRARHRACENLLQGATRVSYHTLIVYRDFYLFELQIVARAAASRRTGKLVKQAAEELFPRIHVQNIGNCTPPAKPKLLIVDEIDRGADRVSPDGAYLYATEKPGERQLRKLLEIAAERRRTSSCVVSFSLASLLPDEKFEMLRFPAGSFEGRSPFSRPRSKDP